MEYNEDIFIIDSWADNDSKEVDLIHLIKMLKQFGTTILLSGHYPVRPEIQKMVDYYLYDGDNPVLTHSEFSEHDVNSGRWTEVDNWRTENKPPFHHDYAIWTTMRNSFNFAKYLNKKYIHFLEYDNKPDPFQYRQSFLEYSRNHDAIVYEYSSGSIIDSFFGEYIATFIFSIKTDIAIQVIDKVKNKHDYFHNRPKGWQLERVFLQHLKEVTDDIFVSKYTANNNELNTQAVWNRDGMDRKGAIIQIYLVCDKHNVLYAHFISGFHETVAEKDYLVEVVYGETKKFHEIKMGKYSILELGEYRKGDRVKVYYQGIEIFNEFLDKQYNEFLNMNKIFFKEECKPQKVNINFIDGAFVEILDKCNGYYKIEFINKDTNKVEYTTDIRGNHWAKPSKQYFINWKIKVTGDDYNYEYDYDINNKRVLIGFESKSVGDTIAWMPYVEEFRKKHNCILICSTFHNDLFKEQYPEIQFVSPGTVVNDLTGLYRLGFFNKEGTTTFDNFKHPSDPKTKPLQMIASDILGLDFKEIRPNLKDMKVNKRKRVSISVHSTAQAKYWNNPTGWQEVTDYLISRGYEVLVLSREESGYMGNFDPNGSIKVGKRSLEGIMKKMQESELFIGISSGLSWLSWGCGVPTILISGFTDKHLEPQTGVHRIINEKVCHGCWSRHTFDPGTWNWCPDQYGTDKMFECSKEITSEDVIDKIKLVLGE